MKTTIIEELELPDDRRAALSREAVRRGIPLNQLVKEVLMNLADRVIGSAEHEKKAA